MWKEKTISLISEIIDQEELKITCVVGSGASVGSGLQTFRGEGGMYEGKNVHELASLHGFKKNPKLVWDWYRERMEKVFAAQPNNLHFSLVKLEKMGVLQKVITQNVDGLHRMAGQSTEKLIEIHGTILKTRCFENCGSEYILDKPPTEIPMQCDCGSYQRPSVVWFGESLNIKNFDIIEESLRLSNLLLIIGTSGQVMPVASIPLHAKRSGIKLMDFNIESTIYQDIVDVFVHGPVEKTMPMFVKIVKKLLKETT